MTADQIEALIRAAIMEQAEPDCWAAHGSEYGHEDCVYVDGLLDVRVIAVKLADAIR